MNAETTQLLQLYGVVTVLLFACGFYCVMMTRNLIRVLIGVELMSKGVTLLLIIAGHVSGHMASAQAMVITFIVVEVVLVPVVAGVIYRLFLLNNSLDVTHLHRLHG